MARLIDSERLHLVKHTYAPVRTMRLLNVPGLDMTAEVVSPDSAGLGIISGCGSCLSCGFEKTTWETSARQMVLLCATREAFRPSVTA